MYSRFNSADPSPPKPSGNQRRPWRDENGHLLARLIVANGCGAGFEPAWCWIPSWAPETSGKVYGQDRSCYLSHYGFPHLCPFSKSGHGVGGTGQSTISDCPKTALNRSLTGGSDSTSFILEA